MRYLLVGDIHLSDRAPSACTDTYLEDLFVLLDHTIDKERELDVAGVVWSGDIFHHKQPSRTSHRTVQRAIEIVQAYNKLWVVPGNHDMLSDRYDSVWETQPLGVLFQTGAELLNGWEETGEHPLYGVPWKQRWDEETVVAAFADWNSSTVPLDQSLVVAHAPLYPPGHELEFEYYPTRAMDPDRDDRIPWSKVQGVGSCYYGHVHEAHGVYKVGDVTFCNQGAITRGSLHESELNRKIAVTVWDSEQTKDGGFTRVDIPHKPADEVFRLMERREVEDKAEMLNDFLESVGQTKLEVTSIEAVAAHIRELNLGTDITSTCLELLADAGAH